MAQTLLPYDFHTTHQASLLTFSLSLVSEVAGVATVVVYSVGQEEHLVATALTFPVDALTGKGLSVDVRAGRETGEVVAEVRARPNTIVALSGVDWASYSLQAGNDLTLPKVGLTLFTHYRVYHTCT